MAEETKTRIPEFSSYEEEAKFWDTHDFGDFLDETEDVDIKFSKGLSENLSVRFSSDVINLLRTQAERMGIGPSTLVRMWVMERLEGNEGARRSS